MFTDVPAETALPYHSVLVANRGEIAVRIIRTLRRLGIRSVAVFSDADADARHVREADTAVRIGPAAATHSYLSIDRLLAAARRAGAQAVHPGYGFLAENAAFARACTEAGLVFVGPPADAIELMGDKIRAKESVRAAGVPVVPGSAGDGLTDQELAVAARQLGMPVLLKPSAGGGGKGMRLVRAEEQLIEEIAAARRAARGAFADDTLLVERWIDRPRHIEIQVLADGHGHVVHLGERECSLQRRHQKVIEEAPSPTLDPATRAAMGEAAVTAARSCGYTGAGTVEFIVPGDALTTGHSAARPPEAAGDPRPADFFFMEMNTRLQVEHPVTELITGVDLVEWQLRVAAGQPLPFAQQAVHFDGHAVEARVCAETARLNGEHVEFLPATGRVVALREPTAPGVRVDSGLSGGMDVGTSYDPMLAKVIAHGPDRPTALRRLRDALRDTSVLGVDTNIDFLRRLADHPAVARGDIDTGLIDREAHTMVAPEVPDEVYAVTALLRQAALWPAPPGDASDHTAATGWVDPFSVPTGWRLADEPAWTEHPLRMPGRAPVTVRVRGTADEAQVRVGDTEEPITARLFHLPPADQVSAGGSTVAPGPTGGRVLLEWAGLTHTFHHATARPAGDSAAAPAGDCHWLSRAGETWQVREHDPVRDSVAGGNASAQAGVLSAPMPGTVTVLKTTLGDRVTSGQSLLVVEAMKMEHVISAPHDGTVTALDVTAGGTVAMDQVMAVVTPHTGEPPSPTAPPRAADQRTAAPGTAAEGTP